MLTCRYHPDRPAVAVFKCHAPNIVTIWNNDQQEFIVDQEGTTRNRDLAHHDNIWLCKECKSDSGMYDRYVPIRTVPVQLDRLPDNWEKEWILLYTWNGEYIFANPLAHVYYVSTIKEQP